MLIFRASLSPARRMASEDWYYANGAEHVGPFSREQITALVRSGALRPETPVRCADATEWSNAEELQESNSAGKPEVGLPTVPAEQPVSGEPTPAKASAVIGEQPVAQPTLAQPPAQNTNAQASSADDYVWVSPAVGRVLKRVAWVTAVLIGLQLAAVAGDLLISAGRRNVDRSLNELMVYTSAAEFERAKNDRYMIFLDCRYGDCSGPDATAEEMERPYGFTIGSSSTVHVLDRPREEGTGTDGLVWVQVLGGEEGVVPCEQIRTLLLRRTSC